MFLNIIASNFVQKHSFSNTYGVRFFFKDYISRHKYLYEKGLNQPSKGVWKTVESQVKVSEKSVNFEKDIEWQPWRCLIAIRVKKG